MTLSVVANIAGGRPHSMRRVYKTCARYDKCLNNGSEYVEK